MNNSLDKSEKVMKPCGRCKGAGHIITGGYQNVCPECEGKGYELVDKEAYYRELRREVRDERYRK
jgi:DnaJ-class molecular chaperone